MEGVMMKNKDIYAVAVRKPNNEIEVELNTHKDISDKVKLFKLPIFRGMMAFVDSMVIGVKVLNYSSSFFDEEEQDTKDKNKKKEKKASKADEDFIVEEVVASNSSQVESATEKDLPKKEDKSNALLMALAVLISIVMSVALFMVLPVFITNFFSGFVSNRYLVLFIEGIVRLAIFIGYVLLASKMNEIKRVFMYHGAEHKTINCLENGFELTVENVRWQSKQHKRCGTSFMLLVILISLVFFMFMPVTNLFWKVISRIVLVPFIAGVSYEFIRLAGKSESKLVDIISQPGLWMQGLTTKEPDDSMIEVAIQSVSAVFDWKAFLETSATQETKGKSVKHGENKQTSNKGNAKLPENKQAANKTNTTKQPENKQAATKANTSKQPENKQASNKANTSKQPENKQATAGNTKPVDKPTEVKPDDKLTEVKPHLEVKPQIGGLAYTGKVEDEHHNSLGRNKGMAPVAFKPNLPIKEDEEDDDILKALDKFFDDTKKNH